MVTKEYIMKKIIAIIGLVFLSACGEPDITGRWIEPLPTIADGAPVQGIILNADGTAESINMATLKYETWSRDGDIITLTGTSIGNGQTIKFSDRYYIKELSRSTLYLVGVDENLVQVFNREKSLRKNP